MKPVVVGIDGSTAAITAALWGTDEAVSAAVPLRLISVIKTTHPCPEDYERDLRHAETSLRAAQAAVAATGKPIKVDTDTPRGPAGAVLVEASRDAGLICVGSAGIGRYARSILGSAASELAEKAHCPVAVIRPDADQPPADINWLVGPSGHPVFRHPHCSVLVAATEHSGAGCWLVSSGRACLPEIALRRTGGALTGSAYRRRRTAAVHSPPDPVALKSRRSKDFLLTIGCVIGSSVGRQTHLPGVCCCLVTLLRWFMNFDYVVELCPGIRGSQSPRRTIAVKEPWPS